MPSTNQLTTNSRSMNGLNTVSANAVFTDSLEVNTLTIDVQGTAPTRIIGDNTTNIATTQFVQSAVTGAGAEFVDLTNNQTVGGIKTFTSVPLCATAPTTGNMLTNKTYVDSVASGGVSLSGNNTWTGFNQFRQETGVFNGSGRNVSMDVYNSGLTITTGGGGTTGQSNSGATMWPQRLVVPAGNKSRTAYISVPIDIFSSSGTAYTGNMTLNFLSVTTNTLRNGASYSGSTTGKAYLTNYTGTTKTWTGFASQIPNAGCYLGDVLIAIPLIVDNLTTDNYDVGIILTGSGAPPGAGVVFVTSWNLGISFTATNRQPSGVVFTEINPFYFGPASIISTNTIVSTDNLNVATSTNDLTISADGSLELNANNGFWTANSVMSENFYFRARLTPNIVLQNIRGVDLLNIQGSSSNILFQTQSNIPLQIDSGTANINITTTGNVNLPLTGTVNLIPPGTIMQGLYTSLTGYLLCDGTSYSTTTYAKLFAVIGYSYGGAGASFNVPDFRGMFLRGNGSQTFGGVTYTGGSLSLAGRQQDQVLSSTLATNQGFRSAAAGARDCVARTQITTDPVDTGTGILAQFPRQGVENRPANYTVNYFIRY